MVQPCSLAGIHAVSKRVHTTIGGYDAPIPNCVFAKAPNHCLAAQYIISSGVRIVQSMYSARRIVIRHHVSSGAGTSGCTAIHEHAKIVAKQLHTISHTERWSGQLHDAAVGTDESRETTSNLTKPASRGDACGEPRERDDMTNNKSSMMMRGDQNSLNFGIPRYPEISLGFIPPLSDFDHEARHDKPTETSRVENSR